MNKKEYKNLNCLYHENIKNFKILFFSSLIIFFMAFASFLIDYFPFGLSLFMMAMILPAFCFGILWLISSIRFRNVLKNFSAQQLNMINQEITFCNKCEGVIVTSQAIVNKKFGVQLIPIKDLLWIYENKTTLRLYGFIPIHQYTLIIFADRNHKKYSFRIKNKGDAFSFIQSELLKIKQDIVFGYEYGMDKIYKKDINRMISFAQQCAEERKNKIQGDVL